MSDIINTAIDLLELQICDYTTVNPDGQQRQSWTSSKMLGSAISTLKTLVAQDSEANTTGIMPTPGIHVGESPQQEQVLSTSGRMLAPELLGKSQSTGYIRVGFCSSSSPITFARNFSLLSSV
jgi:hypothetical protein